MVARARKGAGEPVEAVDARAVLARYRRWLGRQPLASRTRQVYLAQVTAYVQWLAGGEHGGAALREPAVRDWAVRDYKRHLAKALLEHGKLLRTVHAVRWFAEEVFRRRIGRQLNRGESVNDLRRHLWVAQRGNVHHRHHDDQTMQAHCHTLLTNACILWTTLYLQDAVDAHRADGIAVPADLIAHISPACFEHISPWGTYNFDVAGIRRRTRRRPLRPLERH